MRYPDHFIHLADDLIVVERLRRHDKMVGLGDDGVRC